MEEFGKPRAAAQIIEGKKTDNEAVYVAIAERVRADSTGKGQLTSLELIKPLMQDPGKIQSYLGEMKGNEVYKDIRLITAANGGTYLYSEKVFIRRDAEKLTLDEEVRSRIINQVREDSGKKESLTPVNKLGALIPGAELDKIDNHLALMSGDERYKDIHVITNRKGARYLYSEKFLTCNYAELLARAEANDPVAIIADTVRDDSRIYPRLTNLDMFKAPVFKIDFDEMGKYTSELTKSPEYNDIKLIKASTGVIYLYSDLYFNPDLAKATVEWEEVGRYENP